jgi:acyl-CoA thioester hydrolase
MLGLDLASKRARTRQDYPYTLTYRLRWPDNDVFTHMNNPIYGVLCDSVANEFLLTRCGYRLSASPEAAIIANTYFDYFGSVSYPGVVEVGLRVAKLGRSSVMYEVGVFAEGEESVKAVGGSMHVWVGNEGGKLGKALKEGMPERVRRGYESLLEPEARSGNGMEGREKEKEREESVDERRRKAKL